MPLHAKTITIDNEIANKSVSMLTMNSLIKGAAYTTSTLLHNNILTNYY